MRYNLLNLSAICVLSAVLSASLEGCQTEYELRDLKHLSKVCELSGGEFIHDRCSCSGYFCEPGFVCELNTGKCSAESGMAGSCVTDTTFCENGKLQKCIDGVWSTATDCETLVCENRERCAERCLYSSCINGQLRKCEDGLYQIPSQCPYGCDDQRMNCAASACVSNTYRCLDNIQESCVAGSWGDVIECKLGCDEKGQKCISECHEGETRCFDDINGSGTQETCLHGAWSAESCKDDDGKPISCKGIVCGECLNSRTPYDCEDGTNRIGKVITCVAGKKEYSPCTNPVSCDKSNPGQCGDCLNGNILCQDDSLTQIGYQSVCVGGKFSDDVAEECENKSSCLTDTMCGYCRNGFDLSCTNLFSIGMIQECRMGRYHADFERACFNSVSCNATFDACGICTNEDTKCEEDDYGNAALYICTEGDWKKLKDCDFNKCKNERECGM